MIFDNIPKINIGLGAVVLICFFLPWMSIDCVDVSFVRVSGFQLTTGKISVDNARLEELTSQYGHRMDLEGSGDTPSASNQGKPRFYVLVIVVCAGTVIYFSYKMLSQRRRLEILGALIPGGFGTLGMFFFAAFDFGVNVPPDSAAIIQVTPQVGFYGTILGFLGITALNALTLRSFSIPEKGDEPVNKPEPNFVAAEPVILDMDSRHQGDVEIIIDEVPLEKVLDLPQVYDAPAKDKPIPPPGASLCPHCGAVVGIYQSRCMKCSSPLKPGKK